jgi:hypothetical protein
MRYRRRLGLETEALFLILSKKGKTLYVNFSHLAKK